MPTPVRAIRIDDELWSAVEATAEKEGTDVSTTVRKALVAYVKAAAVIVVGFLALSACGSETAPTSTVAEVPVVVASEAPAPTAEAVAEEPAEVEAKPLGETFALDDHNGTLKVTTLETGVYSVELQTSERVVLDGEFIGTDSAGVEHVGTSLAFEQHGQPMAANGYAGDQIRFGSDDIVSITYTATDGGFVVTWLL